MNRTSLRMLTEEGKVSSRWRIAETFPSVYPLFTPHLDYKMSHWSVEYSLSERRALGLFYYATLSLSLCFVDIKLKINGQAMVPALTGRDEPMKRKTLNPWPSELDGWSGYTQGLHWGGEEQAVYWWPLRWEKTAKSYPFFKLHLWVFPRLTIPR